MKKQTIPPGFGDRLRFVIWLSALRLGTDSAKELSAVLGKGSNQLSKWVMENPKPSYATTKRIAEAVGVSPSWLDDPASSDAREPELFAQWWAARQERAKPARKHA